MIRKKTKSILQRVVFLLAGLSQAVYAADTPPNVILLMMDGVRWQEVFLGSDPTIDPQLKESNLLSQLFLKPEGSAFIFGNKKGDHICTVANDQNTSLPGYQSIMAGRDTGCKSNHCGRIQFETLQERILGELKLKKTEVATIASWPTIANAVEHQQGRTFVNAGIQPISEGNIDATTHQLNEKQKGDTPSWEGRKDVYTFAQALNFLKNNRPRFLFISLGDADELGHEGNYPEYISTLKQYNNMIKTLFDTLGGLGSYGRSTSVIVTTDHGRGEGRDWKNHGTDSPESKYIWIFGKNPLRNPVKSLPPVSERGYTHLDIRPSIEKLLGLAPTSCGSCGMVIDELMPTASLEASIEEVQ